MKIRIKTNEDIKGKDLVLKIQLLKNKITFRLLYKLKKQKKQYYSTH